jgi:hypothetical protein
LVSNFLAATDIKKYNNNPTSMSTVARFGFCFGSLLLVNTPDFTFFTSILSAFSLVLFNLQTQRVVSLSDNRLLGELPSDFALASLIVGSPVLAVFGSYANGHMRLQSNQIALHKFVHFLVAWFRANNMLGCVQVATLLHFEYCYPLRCIQ